MTIQHEGRTAAEPSTLTPARHDDRARLRAITDRETFEPPRETPGLGSKVRSRITVSSRPTWSQISPEPLGSAFLAHRMREIADAEFRRWKSRLPIRVEAHDVETFDAIAIERSPWPTVCPHCGEAI
ncbi:hypothetical protein [Homoserinibacter sp. YIM 151385]|uniref:hypothetical protein n=1 Tax=Homoserinibacter sp. YIM 151385 TaxID=2985506 RepID=UPI0022F0264A|nr:hypothetical protein [Homoserinibacter sp. YIM 151385]WBU38532.1 hypothetical protein OF852_02800 [Homoserinibacter sp. YIM 151385]